jgi:hypothetical protein
MDEYCRFNAPDVPYWFGERPLTGLLAAAAWRLPNAWSLEEFSAYRGSGSELGPGRGDAWIGDSSGWWCTLECKLRWVSTIEDPTVATVQARSALGEARKQLANLSQEFRGDRGLSVCYVVPELSEEDPTSKKIEAFYDGLVRGFAGEQAIVAIYRPPAEKSVRGTRLTWENRHYPGVALIGEGVFFSRAD